MKFVCSSTKITVDSVRCDEILTVFQNSFFSGDNYENSTALVITFAVQNTKDEKFQQMALDWEEQFLRLVSSYSSDNISVSYSAEVNTRFLSVFTLYYQRCVSQCLLKLFSITVLILDHC